MAQQTGIFTVFGEVFQTDGVTHAPKGTVVTIKNLNTGVSLDATVGTSEPGKYEATFLDFTNNRAAKVDDILEISARSASGQLKAYPTTYTVTSSDVAAHQVRQNITFSNRGSVSLVSSGLHAWLYRLTWVCGDVTEWRYLGAGITGASVEGSAATAGWVVSSWSSTEVVFTASSSPLTSGSLEGFRITGISGGLGTWRSHDQSGSIDGSLPVTLTRVSVKYVRRGEAWGGLITWQTQSEVNTLGFFLYRRHVSEPTFTKIAFVPGARNSVVPNSYEFFDSDLPSSGNYLYQLEVVDFTGERMRYPDIRLEVPAARPAMYRWRLLPNYPNPFNPETWIPFELAESGEVSLQIRDGQGHLVRTLIRGRLPAGAYLVPGRAAYWDGRDQRGQRVSSGVYFYTLKTANYTATRRMVVVK